MSQKNFVFPIYNHSLGVYFIKGFNNGRYPYSHSMLAGTTLIDTGISNKFIRKIKKEFIIENVILSHWHEDHILGNRFLKNVQFSCHPKDKQIIENTQLMYSNFSYPIRRWGTIGVSNLLLYSGNITARDNSGLPLGVKYSDFRNVFFLSYAHRLNEYIYLGANLKTIIQRMSDLNGYTLERIGAYGQAMDAGIIWAPLKQQLYLGASIVNLFNFYYNPHSQLAQKWPLNLKLSVDLRTLDNKLLIGLDTDLLDLTGPGQPSFTVHYNMDYYLRKWSAVRTSFDNREFGLGFSYWGRKLFNSPDKEIELAYFTGYNYHLAGLVNRFAITARWGLSRKEKEIARLGQIRKMAPINAFSEAMRLFQKKLYWDAAHAFGRVVSLYPDFKKLPLAKFYLAESLFYLGLTQAARTLYEQILEEYPELKQTADCWYKLQKICYLNKNYDEVLSLYQEKRKLYENTVAYFQANYLVGQIYFKRGAIIDAVKVLKPIPVGNSIYPFAQYTLALCYLYLGDNEQMITHFNNILARPPRNKVCLLYTSPSPRDLSTSRMPSSA